MDNATKEETTKRETYVTVEELAKLLNVHRRTIERMVAARRVPAVHVGSAIRLPLNETIKALTPRR